MIRRLSSRKSLIAGGCIFAAVILGVACAGIAPVHAAGLEVAYSASGDKGLSSSSDWSWVASDGNLGDGPPLDPGQEVIGGEYSGFVLVAGPASMQSSRVLSAGDILRFTTSQDLTTGAPGIVKESLSTGSCRAPASSAECGSTPGDRTGANFTRSARCEWAYMSGTFLPDAMTYRSGGEICQGDTENPDSLAMFIASGGNGHGEIAAGARVMEGIGNTSALGYITSASSEIRVSGRFSAQGRTNWTSLPQDT